MIRLIVKFSLYIYPETLQIINESLMLKSHGLSPNISST